MQVRTLAAAMLIGMLVLSGCARKKRAAAPPVPKIGDVENGIASWYGHPYHGRRAANGEIYDMEKMTAAHRTLPFGTWVAVENRTNRQIVKVRITDRGPFIDGRIIDLSLAAARSIEMIGPGTAKVRVKIVAPPKDLPEDQFYSVQVGAFGDRTRAENVRRQMDRKFGPARLVERPGDPTLWRVLVGREPSLAGAQGLAARVRDDGGTAFVVRLDETGH